MKRNPLWPVLMVLVFGSVIAALVQCAESYPVPKPKLVDSELIYCWTDDGRYVEACSRPVKPPGQSSR